MKADESLIAYRRSCEATGVNYGSMYHHFWFGEGVIARLHQCSPQLPREDVAVLQFGSVLKDSEDTPSPCRPSSDFRLGDDRRSRRALPRPIGCRPMMRPSGRTHRRRSHAHRRIAVDRRIRSTADGSIVSYRRAQIAVPGAPVGRRSTTCRRRDRQRRMETPWRLCSCVVTRPSRKL